MAEDDDQLAEALLLMERALELIDSTGKVSDVGAHLDLAVNRLRERLLQAEQLSGGRRLTVMGRGRCQSIPE